MRTPARVTEDRLAHERRLAILRHDAGALTQSSSGRPRRRGQSDTARTGEPVSNRSAGRAGPEGSMAT